MKKQIINSNKIKNKSALVTVIKKNRRNDSIGWIVGAIVIFFITIISLGRISIVGQFIDDVLFTLPFGWCKYLIYLWLLVIGFSMSLGVQIRLKKRVWFLLFLFILIISWSFSVWVTIIEFQNASKTSSGEIVIPTIVSPDIPWLIIKNYLTHWHNDSIFNSNINDISIVGFNGQWITVAAGGGLLGASICGVTSYATIFGSASLSVCFFLMFLSSVFTGTIFGIRFKGLKSKKIKILKLSSGPNKLNSKQNNKKSPKSKLKTKKTWGKMYKTIHIKDKGSDFNEILSYRDESDITIKTPSFTNSYEEDIIETVAKTPSRRAARTKRAKNKNYDFKLYNDELELKANNEDIKQLEQQDILDPTFFGSDFNNYDQEIANSKPYKLNNQYGVATSKTGNIKAAREMLSDASKLSPFGILNSKSKKKSLHDATEFASSQPGNMQELDTKQNQQINSLGNSSIGVKSKSQINNNSTPNLISRPSKVKINKNYKLPYSELLEEPKVNENDNKVNKEATFNKAEKINEIFKIFNVEARVDNAVVGPSVTRYEIQLDLGVKVNKILKLENDLKLALASQKIRLEAPIQGKSRVGIEVPNARSNKVYMKELIDGLGTNKKIKNSSEIPLALGKTVVGEVMYADLAKMPHLLIAGSTGSGKSVCINTIIASLLLTKKPHELKLLMIDPKKVELSVYEDIPHLLSPIISDTKVANQALKQIVLEMENRYTLLQSKKVRNICDYNKVVSESERLPFIVVIIDELADLMMTVGREVEDSIMRITQLARAAGIHLIVATQRPSVDIITGVIKTNIPSRISFYVSSAVDSRTILDQSGAEQLIGQGDLLFSGSGSMHLLRAQGAFISDEEITSIVDYITSQEKAVYNIDFSMQYEQQQVFDDIVDDLYEEIKNFVIQQKKASTSLLQRKFQIGYNRASRIIDALEENGVIGSKNGVKPREVLV